MFGLHRVGQGVIASLVLSAACGCTIQDVLRATAGGVNSDRAALNKINSANQYSFPEPGDRTEIPWPKREK